MSDYCKEAVDKLYQYIDSELDPKTASEIRTHLDDCGPCCDSFEFEARLKGVIREHLSESVPTGLVDRVKQLIHDETANPSS